MIRIAIDVSPLKDSHLLAHRVRGTGFYIENLNNALNQYFPDNKYTFFTRGQLLPKNIDLIHYPYFEPFFLTLPFFSNRKTVVTVHDLTPLVFKEYFPIGIRGAIKWQIQKLALCNANGIITDSQCSKKDIIKFTGIDEKKVHVIYLAASEKFKQITSTVLLENIRNKYKLPQKFVLYVGDVTWNKNLPRLVKAIKEINLTLVMVGKALKAQDFDKTNPWNQDLLEVQNEAKNDKRLINLGFVHENDLVAIYNLATVFVMPSLYEGFGLPVLEAMKCGTPVVTTKNGSLPEVAGDAAFYVDAYDVHGIANGIGEVFFNKELQKELSQKGLKQAKKFSWEKTAEETIKIYQKICKISL